MINKIDVFTDGACSKNGSKDAIGGVGIVVNLFLESKKTIYSFKYQQAFSETTNNRMELTAAISALKIIQEKHKYYNFELDKVEINLFTDSSYVKDGITKWIKSWKQKNWKTAQGKPVLNKELWQELDELNKQFKNLQWQWVKGHADNHYNEIADELATSSIKLFNEGNLNIVKEISGKNYCNFVEIPFNNNDKENTSTKETTNIEKKLHIIFNEDNFNEKIISIINKTQENEQLNQILKEKSILLDFEFENKKHKISFSKEKNKIMFIVFKEQLINDEIIFIQIANGEY